MASKTLTMKLFSLLVFWYAIVKMATASDPDILTDFLVPKISALLMETFSHLLACVPLSEQTLQPHLRSLKQAWLNPQLWKDSVSYAVLEFANGTTNQPHIHPRSAELLFLVVGSLQIGFVDTANKLYTQTLQTGDMFVFPKGFCLLSVQCKL